MVFGCLVLVTTKKITYTLETFKWIPLSLSFETTENFSCFVSFGGRGREFQITKNSRIQIHYICKHLL